MEYGMKAFCRNCASILAICLVGAVAIGGVALLVADYFGILTCGR